MNNQSLSVLAFTAALGFSGAAGAGLIDRGGGLIYDNVLNITWLQDANYAFTSGYAAANLENDGGYDDIFADGRMGWDAAKTWAANLTYYDSVRGVTYDDWRLPIITDTGTSGCDWAYTNTDCGYNVQTYNSGTVYSELAYMYHVNLGLKSYYNTSGTYQADWGVFGNGTCNGSNCNSLGQNDVGLIQNLQAYGYWSGIEYAPDSLGAWYFNADDGVQDAGNKDDVVTTHGPCAPAMSLLPPLLPSPNRAVLRWSG